MENTAEQLHAPDADPILAEQTVELLRINAALRDELEELRRSNAELVGRLRAATLGSAAERQSRLAALNLMEDAVAARLAEQRENAERRRIEEQLREADHRKDEFLATLAHELRNPLAPIRSSVQLLRRLPPGGAQDKMYDMLERQVNHLVRLVDDLMEVSRITRGKIELRPETVDLGGIFRCAVECSRPLIETARQQLEVTTIDGPLTLAADPVRIVQVITNLLNNASKYTEDGGNITLCARREGSSAVISVKDSGVGIPSELLPRVFDLFTQVDRTLNRAQGGLGIGLALVRTLVGLHGGTIDAQSGGPGEGSEFVVTLPLTTEQIAAPGTGRVEEASDIAAARILLVDDNRDAVQSVAAFLELLGAKVCIVHDGQAALVAFETFRPAIALLDIGMPGMDGYELARRARATIDGRAATLIALTGWGQEDDRRRSREAGFDHHLVKPVNLDELHVLLASLVNPRSDSPPNDDAA